jgi:hypothetical protein
LVHQQCWSRLRCGALLSFVLQPAIVLCVQITLSQQGSSRLVIQASQCATPFVTLTVNQATCHLAESCILRCILERTGPFGFVSSPILPAPWPWPPPEYAGVLPVCGRC